MVVGVCTAIALFIKYGQPGVPVRAGGAGTVSNDVFTNVVLQDGNHAIDYNFGEHKPDVSAIPTLSQWSLALLALLMAGFAVRRRVHG